jgi:hypothetical protein
MFDGRFRSIGSFTDPNVASQYPGNTVFQVENEDGKLFVTFAGFAPPFGGVVDVFNSDGRLLTPKHFAANAPGAGPLVNPWGIVRAPADFGPFGNDLLIGNVEGAGNINAFDPHTGHFLGQLQHPDGTPVAITGLWDLVFGGGQPANGRTDDLYFDAGFTAADPAGNGLFGVLRAAEDGEDLSTLQERGGDLAGAMPPLASGPALGGQQTARPAAQSISPPEAGDRGGASARAVLLPLPGADSQGDVWAPFLLPRKRTLFDGDGVSAASVTQDPTTL